MNGKIETVLALLSQGELETDYGNFIIHVFYDGLEEGIALVKGKLEGEENVLCRIHSECITSHVFFSKECDCITQMQKAQQTITEAGRGLIIFLRQEGRGNGAAAHIATQKIKKELKISQSEAYKTAGFPVDNRKYEIAGKIIKYFKIKSINLLSSNINKINALISLGIKITGHDHLYERRNTYRSKYTFITPNYLP